MNNLIVKKLQKLTELLKIEINLLFTSESKTSNMYRIDAIEKNAKYIKNMTKTIKSENDVKNIKGFGKGTISRIKEILDTGDLKELKILKYKLKNLYKKHQIVEKLCTVIGIGQIIGLQLVNLHNITSLEDFKARVKSGDIEVNDKIRLGLKYEGKFEKIIKRKYITNIYNNIKNYLSIESIVCGSYRRGKETSHDIDLLLCDKKLVTLDDVKNSTKLSKIIRKLKKNKIITDDITSENVKTKYMGFTTYKNKLYRIDIRLVPYESYYSSIVYFTGSYETNIRMRNKAKKLAYKLSEYGIFNVMGKKVPINSEQDVFRILRMPYLEPWER